MKHLLSIAKLSTTEVEHLFQLACRLKEALECASPEAVVILCSPFDVTREVQAEVIASKYFAGYEQKSDLYPVHKAILVSLLE